MKYYYSLCRFFLYGVPLLLCVPFQFKEGMHENPIFWIISLGGTLLVPIAYRSFTFEKVTHKLFLLYDLILTLLIPFSINIEISFYIVLLNWNFFIFFLASNKLLQEEKSKKILAYVFFASVSVLSFISLYNTVLRHYINRELEGVSYMWFYYGHNHVAFLLLLFIPLNFYFIWISKGYKKLILYLFLIIACFSLFLSKARAAPLGLLIGSLITLSFLKTNFKKNFSAPWVLIGIVAVIGCIFAFTSIQKGTYGTSDRIDYWQKGIQLFLEKPLTGYGLGSFGKKYSEKKTGRLASFYTLNIFIQSAAETGIFGLANLVALLIACLNQAVRFIQKLTVLTNKLFFLALLVGLISMLINDLMDFDLQLPVAGLIFWIFLGMFSLHQKSLTSSTN